MLLLLALLHLALPPASTAELKLTKLYERGWAQRGWLFRPHQPTKGPAQVIALNEVTLDVKTLEAISGRVVKEEGLDTAARAPRLVRTLSTRGGEFAVAFAFDDAGSNEHLVQLHLVGSPVSFEAVLTKTPDGLTLVEAGPKQLFLFVVIEKSVEVYRRDVKKGELVFVTRITSETGVSEFSVVGDAGGLAWVYLTGGDAKLRVMTVDGATGAIKAQRNLGAPGLSFLPPPETTGEPIVAVVGPAASGANTLRFLNGGKLSAEGFPLDTALGDGTWVRRGSDMLYAFTEKRPSGQHLVIVDPKQPGASAWRTPIGEATEISDPLSLLIDKQNFAMFVRDHRALQISGDGPLANIPAKDEERIIDARLTKVGASTIVLFTLEGPAGARVQAGRVN